jgi:predicted outer membrane protein
MSTFRSLLIVPVGILLGVAITPARADLSEPDRGFASQAERDNISEIQDAQLANTSHAPPPVKLLAQKIIKDRTTALADLKKAARDQNFTLPNDPLPQQKQQRADLTNLAPGMSSNPDKQKRDQAYVTYEISRLQEEASLLGTEVNAGKNRQVEEYAHKYLPIIQAELKEAQSINLPR